MLTIDAKSQNHSVSGHDIRGAVLTPMQSQAIQGDTMDPDWITRPRMPFSPIQGEHGVAFRQNTRTDALSLEIALDGHDDIVFDVRDTSEPTGRHALLLSFDACAAGQLSSILAYLVGDHERALSERVDSGEFRPLGARNTATARLTRRRSCSQVLNLTQRCLEVCEEETFIKELTMNLALWAARSGDGLAVEKAGAALYQMDMVPAEDNGPNGAERKV